MDLFGLRTKVFPGYVKIRRILRARQQDVSRTDRSFAEVALAAPTLATQTVQESGSWLDDNRVFLCFL
jgi:hypothetical protein